MKMTEIVTVKLKTVKPLALNAKGNISRVYLGVTRLSDGKKRSKWS